MVRTQVQLTKAQAARLRALARRRGVSMAALMREAIEGLSEESAMERHRRALAAVGKFRSSDRTVARDHDRHLIEGYRS